MGSSFILVQSMYFKLAVWNEKVFQVEFNIQAAFLQSLKNNQVYQLPRQFILKMDHLDSTVLFWKRHYVLLLHSPSNCLAWSKFWPWPLVTNKLWLIFMGMMQKNKNGKISNFKHTLDRENHFWVVLKDLSLNMCM